MTAAKQAESEFRGKPAPRVPRIEPAHSQLPFTLLGLLMIGIAVALWFAFR